jgi:chemotaxis protein histidine kinase CheA
MTDPLAEVLRTLRRDYLRDAPQRVAELREQLAAVERGDAAALDTLRRSLHRLAGSGGSYGFDVVSSSARAGEHAARRALERGGPPGTDDLAELRAAVERVDAAFAEARSAEGSPPA